MKSRGRKPKIYSEEILIKIINEFLNINTHIQTIKYRDIYEYALEQHNKGVIDFKLSDDFWRKSNRQGKLLVDEINRKRSVTLEKNLPNIDVIPTADVVNRLSNDSPAVKKLIINQLKVNEHGYKKLSKNYFELKNKESKMEKEIKELKSEIANLKKNNEIYQNVLFQWANLSSNRDIGFVNVITTGKTRSETVEQLFKDMFNEQPNKAILNVNEVPEVDNLIELPKVKNTLIEDLDL